MSSIPAWLLFATIALVFWGITGVTQKLSTNRISSQLSCLWWAWAMVAISAELAFTVPIQWHPGALILSLSILGGALNGLGALTSFAALESGGKVSVVISLISLYPLLTVAIAVLFLNERLTPLQALGAVMAIVAAILLSIEAPSAIASPESQSGR
jgi:bacterial/archaeal transporter family protein